MKSGRPTPGKRGPGKFRRSAAFAATLVIALGAPLADAAPPADTLGISFDFRYVEDKYAIDLPGFRDLFRFLDVGYAGCSIGLTVRAGAATGKPGQNKKIEVEFEIELKPGTAPFKLKAVSSLERADLILYLNNRCADVRRIRITKAACFGGLKGEFGKLPCPYRFGGGTFAIGNFYRDSGQG